MSSKLPDIVVFDLDYTIWPFWVDTHVDAPFSLQNGKVYDCNNRLVKLYRDVKLVFEDAKKLNIKIGIASRTSYTEEAQALMRLFNISQLIEPGCCQIYPGCKKTHLHKISETTGIPYQRMIFFDDEHRNIVDCSKIGVFCIFVEDGVSFSLWKHALAKFAKS